MSEAEWLAGNDWDALADFLWAKVSDRKLRLIACGCCRRVWGELTDRRSRDAVEVGERFADGQATEDDLRSAVYYAEAVVFDVHGRGYRYRAEQEAIRSGLLPRYDAVEEQDLTGRARRAAEAAEYAAAGGAHFLQQADRSVLSLAVVRDVVGNPFRPLTTDPAWLTPTAVQLARGIYGERDFSAMPILADALQDAGCDHPDVLAHCRDPQQVHVRGCWVVDLVLGKT